MIRVNENLMDNVKSIFCIDKSNFIDEFVFGSEFKFVIATNLPVNEFILTKNLRSNGGFNLDKI